jgi:hypothetical protein
MMSDAHTHAIEYPASQTSAVDETSRVDLDPEG